MGSNILLDDSAEKSAHWEGRAPARTTTSIIPGNRAEIPGNAYWGTLIKAGMVWDLWNKKVIKYKVEQALDAPRRSQT
jgi:hypothetical protein